MTIAVRPILHILLLFGATLVPASSLEAAIMFSMRVGRGPSYPVYVAGNNIRMDWNKQVAALWAGKFVAVDSEKQAYFEMAGRVMDEAAGQHRQSGAGGVWELVASGQTIGRFRCDRYRLIQMLNGARVTMEESCIAKFADLPKDYGGQPLARIPDAEKLAALIRAAADRGLRVNPVLLGNFDERGVAIERRLKDGLTITITAILAMPDTVVQPQILGLQTATSFDALTKPVPKGESASAGGAAPVKAKQ